MNAVTAEPVRLVIWDLDETFWHGTLTEGGIVYRRDAHDIVVALAKRGIISGICSKNDIAPVQALLQAEGLWDYFILPSVDWTAKGPRLAALVDAVQLRPATVLFIDDNPANLAEAQAYVPGIQVALPDLMEGLLDNPLFTGKDDAGLTRLAQYKLLEQRQQAAAQATDNTAFLRECGIAVSIEPDVEKHIDRAIELINRTNQLNFTKDRLPEDQGQARDKLRAMLLWPGNQSALVRVRDRFGDHGFAGFYMVRNQRGQTKKLMYFCFSCRILGMGVETWLYRRLGLPELTVVGDVLSDPAGDKTEIDWISVEHPGSIAPTAPGTSAPTAARLEMAYLRGACYVRPMSHFFAMVANEVVEGFDTARNGRTMPLNHSMFGHYALHGVPEGARDAFLRLGYEDDDFTAFARLQRNGSTLWLLNFWTELGGKLYRHNTTGALIPVAFSPERMKQMRAKLGKAAADARNWDPAAAGDDAETVHLLREQFTHVGAIPQDVLRRNMLEMVRAAPANTQVVLLLANETRLNADGTVQPAPYVKTINEEVRLVAEQCPRALLIDVADCIRSKDDLLVEQPLKLHRTVFFRLFEEVMRRWEAVEGGTK